MFINWNSRELHIKIVYYGPPLSGKTTNLEQLYGRLPADKRTDLVSVKTREDRTLFFDFMQLELGQIKGLLPKFKLYTVPGQSYYAATRKLVLRDVDGIVFVADSSVERLAANRKAMQDMWQHLSELEQDKSVPLVLQCNKQDVPNAVKPELLRRFLAVPDTPTFGAVAIQSQGTAETLKHIIGQVVAQM